MNRYEIMVADSIPAYLEGIKISIRQLPSYVEIKSCSCIHNLIYSISSTHRDLVILDTDLISDDILGRLSATINRKNLKVLLVFKELTDQVRKIEKKTNCSGLLKKTAESMEFNLAVMTILQGGKYFPEYPNEKSRVPPLSEEELSLLTTQEINILTFVTKGDLNKQIAAKMNITEDTVKAHVSSMLKKLRIPNRTTLAIAHFRYSDSNQIH